MASDLNMEFEKIKGYENYKITKDGEIFSIKRRIFLKPCTNGGYKRVVLTDKDSLRKNFYVHVLVAKTFIPNNKNKPQVNHIDGVKTNNHVDNLEWVTVSENIKHAYRIGLKSVKGEKGPSSKLNDWKVRIIKRLLSKKEMTHNDIGIFFDVSRDAVTKIKNNVTWTHI